MMRAMRLKPSGDCSTQKSAISVCSAVRAVFLAWTTSPDTLWFLAHDASGHGSIWSLSLGTGAKRPLVRLEDPARLIGPTLATDQRRFYFTLDERFSNISWAELEGR